VTWFVLLSLPYRKNQKVWRMSGGRGCIQLRTLGRSTSLNGNTSEQLVTQIPMQGIYVEGGEGSFSALELMGC